MLGSQPGEEPLPGTRPQVQDDGHDVMGAGRRDLPDGVVELGGGVGQERDHRAHQHAAGQPALVQRGARLQPPGRRRGARLDGPPQVLVGESRGHVEAHLGDLGRRGEQVGVPQDQRALGQDRERVGGGRERADDAGHQLVAALGPLVAVHVHADRDVLARPARRGQLLADQLGRVDLDHDLRVEVGARVHVQVGVGVPGEAVVAHHPVGDEVAGAGGDVVHRQVQPQRLDGHDCGAWRRS